MKRLRKLENKVCRQIQDLHASIGIKEIKTHRGCSRSWKCRYTLFLPPRVEIEPIFSRSMGRGFRDVCPFSELPFSGIKLGHLQRFQNMYMYLHGTPRGRNWAYFRPTGMQKLPRCRPIFKVAIFGHKICPLAKFPACSCTFTLFLLQGVEIDLNVAIVAIFHIY